jgi:cysteine desulfurase/selenocysteine lyase
MENLIYLDNAATTFPKPPEVLEFMMDFYRTHGVNPGRTGFDLALEAEEMILKTRRRLTGFFGGTDPSRLVFGYNATDMLNLLINSLLQPGDHAVTTCLEHNSVLRPLFCLNKYRGVEVDYVPFDKCGYVDPEDIRAAIKDNTKLVVVNHGSNVLGTLQPAAEIGAICRAKGVTFAIDSAQTAGVVPIDACGMNIDAVCFTGHKSLMGPTGIGGMYICEELHFTPDRSGGTGVDSALREQPESYPWRLEFGTPNTIGIAGLLAGQEWIEKQGGPAKIWEHEMKLARRLVEGLSAIEGVVLYCADPEKEHLPVITFNVDGFEPADTGMMLDVDYDIACRTGLHCAPRVHETLGTEQIKGTVRFSIGPFNTMEHIEKAIAAVGEIARTARKKKG